MEIPAVSTIFSLSDAAPTGVLGELRRTIDAHRGQPMGELLGERGLGAYRGMAEVLEHLEQLSTRGARLLSLGRSVCGECLFALALGPEQPGPDTRTTVVLAGLHPMEWIGVEAELALLDRLVAEPPRERAVLCIPLANPDGWLRVEHYLRTGRRRFVRHNARGVDLNRNFDTDWGRGSLAARLVPWLYRPGRHPASEPEVAAIANGLSSRRIDRAVALHSFGSCVLYPSGRGLLPIADAPEHAAWARRVAAAIGGGDGRVCPASRMMPGFGAGGMELDWFHRRHGALSLLVECPGGGVPRRLGRLTHPFAWFNPERPRDVADRVADALLGFVRGDEAPDNG
jgi:hypothetical protein